MTADSEDRKSPAKGGAKRRGRAERPTNAHVSNALRSAYEEAVKEDVPAEFLELLGKLA